MADTLYIHIGLPKTATTFLQREVFPSLEGLRYLGTPQSDLFSTPNDLSHGQRLLTGCVSRSALVWERYGEDVFEDLFSSERSARSPGDALVSDEGVGRSGSRPALLAAHLVGLAEQAQAWGFVRTRVLCVIRRQDHWLASHYAQISDRYPEASQGHFEDGVQQKVDPAGERYGFGMLLDYAVLVDHLQGAVGGDNVCVLPYEWLKADSDAFQVRLRDFLGVGGAQVGSACRQNVRSRGRGEWALRPSRRERVIRLRPSRAFAALGLPDEVRLAQRTRGGKIRLTDAISALVLGEYQASNRAVAKRLGIDLAPYGYYPAD